MTTLCYLASPSYSGSTLLSFLLGTHPRIATVGELKGRLYSNLDVPKRCSCGESVPECPFWKAAARRLAERGIACDLHDIDTYFHAPGSPTIDRLLRTRVRGFFFERVRAGLLRHWPGARRELERLLARNAAIIEVICELQEGDVLLDSSKDAVRLKFLLESGRWDVKVVQLVRDGRGTANSYKKRDGFAMERATSRWLTAHGSYRALLADVPADDLHLLRYEDLCSDPRGAVNGVLDFLGLEPDQIDLEFMNTEHHVFGNPMRLRSSSEIQLDERWREELDAEDLATFERIAGPENRAFGYGP